MPRNPNRQVDLKALAERRYVLQLLTSSGREIAQVKSGRPPAPDVQITYRNGAREVFEVTQVHPDQTGHRGSKTREAEMRRARGEPAVITSTWISTNPLPALKSLVEGKAEKAPGYSVNAGETLSLLLVGSIPEIGAVASTFVLAPFLQKGALDAALHEVLVRSWFQNVYLHLPLSGNSVWGWNRREQWTLLRKPQDSSHEGLEALESFMGLALSGLLPGTKTFGRVF